MKKSDKNEDWTDQSLREVIEIDPVHDLKGYNNPETLRQALGRLTFTRHEKKNQGKHYPCEQFDIRRHLLEGFDWPFGAHKDNTAD